MIPSSHMSVYTTPAFVFYIWLTPSPASPTKGLLMRNWWACIAVAKLFSTVRTPITNLHRLTQVVKGSGSHARSVSHTYKVCGHSCNSVCQSHLF